MKSSKFRLFLGAAALVLIGFTVSSQPVQSSQCFQCRPDGQGGTGCKLTLHGMTACDDGGTCTLSGSTC